MTFCVYSFWQQLLESPRLRGLGNSVMVKGSGRRPPAFSSGSESRQGAPEGSKRLSFFEAPRLTQGAV